jgi:hypothetical protein
MYLFVLAVWLWNVWLGVMALKAYQVWQAQAIVSDEPVDVNKLD